MSNSNDAIVKIIEGVLSDVERPIELHTPEFLNNEWSYVKECIDTGWVSSVGSFVTRFEKQLTEVTGAKYAVACVNGTAALHMSLLLAGVEPNDEVLLPALTFVGTANPVAYCGAKPHFIDSEPATLGIDVAKLEAYLKEVTEQRSGQLYNKRSGARVRALIAMHTFGHPCSIDKIKDLCEKFGLALIEDAAEAIGSTFDGKHVGNAGLVAALSFNGNKTITTGGGGAILTNVESVAKRAKHLTTVAKRPHDWEFLHDEVAYNYRLPNINAALGCAQLENLPSILKKKRILANKYLDAFKNCEDAVVFKEPAGAQSNYWLNCILLKQRNYVQVESLLKKLHDRGLKARPAWRLLHQLPMFTTMPRMNLDQSEDIAERIVSLPSSSHLVKA